MTTATLTHADLASQIKDACTKVPAAGRFAGKVWIHAAWSFSGMDVSLDEFKAAVLDLSRRGHLVLSRCDLVEAADPHDVRRSRVLNGGWEFNLIRA